MICPTQELKKNGFSVPDDAKRAIAEGVRRGDPVAELESLGLSPRVIALLENSRFEIITLEQLVARNRDELLEISGLADHGLGEVMNCLSRYHQLADAQAEMEDAFTQRLRHTTLPISQPRQKRTRQRARDN